MYRKPPLRTKNAKNIPRVSNLLHFRYIHCINIHKKKINYIRKIIMTLNIHLFHAVLNSYFLSIVIIQEKKIKYRLILYLSV